MVKNALNETDVNKVKEKNCRFEKKITINNSTWSQSIPVLRSYAKLSFARASGARSVYKFSFPFFVQISLKVIICGGTVIKANNFCHKS